MKSIKKFLLIVVGLLCCNATLHAEYQIDLSDWAKKTDYHYGPMQRGHYASKAECEAARSKMAGGDRMLLLYTECVGYPTYKAPKAPTGSGSRTTTSKPAKSTVEKRNERLKAIKALEKKREQEREINVIKLNDLGFEAYERGDYSEAMDYFQKALEHDPYNYSIKQNIQASKEKIGSHLTDTNIDVPDYLSSVAKTLNVASISSNLIKFYLSPKQRLESNKQLIEKSMKIIAKKTATFVLEEDGRKLELFEYDSKEEKQRKLEEAKRHALIVEKLRKAAYIEAKERAEQLRQSDVDYGEVEIIPGESMSQMLNIAETGEW